jgi:hypothetical protein
MLCVLKVKGEGKLQSFITLFWMRTSSATSAVSAFFKRNFSIKKRAKAEGIS